MPTLLGFVRALPMAAILAVAFLGNALFAEPAPATGGWVSATGEPSIEVHNERLALESLEPGWSPKLAKRFPGFVDVDAFPVGQVASAFVVVDSRGVATSMPFEAAYERSTDQSKPRVWIVGAHK